MELINKVIKVAQAKINYVLLTYIQIHVDSF